LICCSAASRRAASSIVAIDAFAVEQLHVRACACVRVCLDKCAHNVGMRGRKESWRAREIEGERSRDQGRERPGGEGILLLEHLCLERLDVCSLLRHLLMFVCLCLCVRLGHQ
jgi:hypothetical protein